jgi:hypothetical protein
MPSSPVTVPPTYHRHRRLEAARTIVVILGYVCCHLANANPDAKRLYDDLLFQNDYNVLIRPVSNHRNNLTVEINLKLSALVDVVRISLSQMFRLFSVVPNHCWHNYIIGANVEFLSLHRPLWPLNNGCVLVICS